jgi:hypothetical protein
MNCISRTEPFLNIGLISMLIRLLKVIAKMMKNSRPSNIASANGSMVFLLLRGLFMAD